MCCENICQAFGANGNCCQENILYAEEDKKRFTLQLPTGSKETVCRIHVDGCLIQDNDQRKCDYWFRICKDGSNDHQNYFVEFKGSDVEYGFDQIIATIAQVRQKGIPLPKATIYGLIVANRVPMRTTEVQILKERFKKQHGADLNLKSKRFDLVL